MPATSDAKRISALSLLGTCSAIALATAWLPEAAIAAPTLSATAAYSLGGGGTTNVPNPAPPPDIFPSDSDGTNNVFAHVYTYDNGINGSRSSGSNTYSMTGTSQYTDTFTNTGASPAHYLFHFQIESGDLSVSLNPDAIGSQSASLSAIIKVDTTTMFDYEATMSLALASATPSFSESGAVLNAGGPTLSTGSGEYGWGAYAGTIDLGTLDPGDSVTVDYQLISSAIGAMTELGACSGYGGYGGYGDTAFGATGIPGGACGDAALARIGDPFDGSGTPTDPPSAFGFTAAPEPASMALLGAGLAGLAFARRRARG